MINWDIHFQAKRAADNQIAKDSKKSPAKAAAATGEPITSPAQAARSDPTNSRASSSAPATANGAKADESVVYWKSLDDGWHGVFCPPGTSERTLTILCDIVDHEQTIIRQKKVYIEIP